MMIMGETEKFLGFIIAIPYPFFPISSPRSPPSSYGHILLRAAPAANLKGFCVSQRIVSRIVLLPFPTFLDFVARIFTIAACSLSLPIPSVRIALITRAGILIKSFTQVSRLH